MKAEEQILELLAEVLRKQDRMQATQDQMQGQLGSLENKVELLGEEVQLTNERLNVVIQTQQAHQQVLRTLATEQQRQRGEIEGIRDSVDNVARMQRDQNRRLDRLEHPGDFV